MSSPQLCCDMRRYFIFVLTKHPHETKEPDNVLDFVRLGDDGRPVLYIRFCPWCGKELDDAQARRITSTKTE